MSEDQAVQDQPSAEAGPTQIAAQHEANSVSAPLTTGRPDRACPRCGDVITHARAGCIKCGPQRRRASGFRSRKIVLSDGPFQGIDFEVTPDGAVYQRVKGQLRRVKGEPAYRVLAELRRRSGRA